MNFKNCVYISWKIQILTILRHKITQIFTKKYYLLTKFSKLNTLETHFCELLRPHATPFQKIKWNPWNLVTTLQKSCFLEPTIFEIPQSNWYYCTYILSMYWFQHSPHDLNNLYYKCFLGTLKCQVFFKRFFFASFFSKSLSNSNIFN